MSKHTPGPWRWDTDFNGLSNMDMTEAVLYFEPWEGMHLSYYADQKRREANANLIAAAPNLLSIAERLVKWDTDYPVNCDNGYAGLKALNELIADAKLEIASVRGEA